jgi:serine protease Do
MGRLDKLVVALLAALLIFYVGTKRPPLTDDPIAGRRPLPPAAQEPATPSPAPQRVRRPPLGPPSPSDPASVVAGEKPLGPTIGTAFAVDDDGTWMTARHVVFDCARIGLFRRNQPATRADVVFAHETADLALIRSDPRGRPLQFVDRRLTLDEDGFALGYPKGVIGAAYFQLLGRSRLQHAGWMGGASPVLTWADVRRFPDDLDTLGGMSGGPVVDDEGRLVGVVVAGSPRRGRQHSLAPELLEEVRKAHLAGRAVQARPIAEVGQGPEKLREIADAVTRGLRVAQVFCDR